MNTYTVKVALIHTFISTEELEITVEAANAEEAETLAEKQALRQCRPDSWDAECDDTTVDYTDIIKCDSPEGEEDIVVRCDRTPDMFELICRKENIGGHGAARL